MSFDTKVKVPTLANLAQGMFERLDAKSLAFYCLYNPAYKAFIMKSRHWWILQFRIVKKLTNFSQNVDEEFKLFEQKATVEELKRFVSMMFEYLDRSENQKHSMIHLNLMILINGVTKDFKGFRSERKKTRPSLPYIYEVDEDEGYDPGEIEE